MKENSHKIFWTKYINSESVFFIYYRENTGGINVWDTFIKL